MRLSSVAPTIELINHKPPGKRGAAVAWCTGGGTLVKAQL